MGNHCKKEKEFSTKKPLNIRINAVGESLYELHNAEKDFFLKGEEVELVVGNLSKKPLSGRSSVFKLMLINSLTGSMPALEHLFCKIKIVEGGYNINMTIPWTQLHVDSAFSKLCLPFDLLIADNDKTHIQKCKIAIFSDGGISKLGSLLLIDDLHFLPPSNIVLATKRDILLPRMKKFYSLDNIFYGKKKDKYDLSASASFTWDRDNLYIEIRVLDNIISMESGTFEPNNGLLDYGYIEDAEGKKVWEMDLMHTKWAGGSLKNQYVDTTLLLQPGRYKVVYITDESHSYDHWDSPPPQTPFYGIKIFSK